VNAAKSEGVTERATFREQNLFEADLSGATVISTYLLPEMNLKLRPKLLDLPSGTRIVAHDYHMGNWLPDERETLSVPEKKVGNPGVSYVYLWYVPARVAGRWKTAIPVGNAERELEFTLDQRFQTITARPQAVGGRPARMRTPVLRGGRLTFSLELGPGRPPVRYEFAGEISGETMRGAAQVWENNQRREHAFTARRVAAGTAVMN
jgi:hypothetical protein